MRLGVRKVHVDHIDYAIVSHLERYRYRRKSVSFRVHKDFRDVNASGEVFRLEAPG